MILFGLLVPVTSDTGLNDDSWPFIIIAALGLFPFILGLIMGMMFFMTFPLIIFLVLVDLLTLWLSGIISIHSISKVLKETKSCSKPVLVFAIICQFIFCADVISLFVVKSLTKNKYS